MKHTRIELCGQIIDVYHDLKEPYNQVVIYEYDCGKAVPKFTGETLREACTNWITSYEEIDNLIVNMEKWAIENQIDLESPGVANVFEQYVNKLDGYELFALLSFDSFHAYVDWTTIEEDK